MPVFQVRGFTTTDRLQPVQAALKQADGTPVNLTGNTVSFRMVDTLSGEVKVNNSPATVVSPTAGTVSYSFAAADVDTPGEYWAWFIRTSGGLTEHFPTGRDFKVQVEPNT